jgi:hypothetical protein
MWLPTLVDPRDDRLHTCTRSSRSIPTKRRSKRFNLLGPDINASIERRQ